MSADAHIPLVDETIACAQRLVVKGMFEEASRLAEGALSLAPEHPPAMAFMGTVLGHRGEHARAAEWLEAALTRAPGHPVWYGNLCAAYRSAGRPEDALQAALVAGALDPGSAQFLLNLVLCLMDVDRFDDATDCALKALAVAPEDAHAHFVMGLVLLTQGRYGPGWGEYEWRTRMAGQAIGAKVPGGPWNGMDLGARDLLVIADQGFGDCFQFSRFLPFAAGRCRDLHLVCSPPLRPLLSRLPGVSSCTSDWEALPRAAAHCRISSLPGLAGVTLEQVPSWPPRLEASPESVLRWARDLGARPARGGLRVGLVWAGSPANINDARRSLPLSRLAPLGALAERGVDFVSLQTPVAAQHRDDWALIPGLDDLSGHLTDFGVTAGLLMNLDLVIAVDTAVAHLSAALGRPTWILIGKTCDWRWLLERDDSPWYPSVRLFRQERSGDWSRPVAAVAEALAALLARRAED